MKKPVILMILLTVMCFSGCGHTEEKAPVTTATTVPPLNSSETSSSTNSTFTTDISSITEASYDTSSVITTTAKITSTETKTLSTQTTVTVKQPEYHADSYFNDAIFIGDSVTLKLKLYCMKQANKGNYPIGSPFFFTSGSFSWANSLWSTSQSDSVHPIIDGKKRKISEAISITNSKKAFIMLGMNDIGAYGIDKSVSNVRKVIDEIQATTPDVQIFIQSVTPMTKEKERTTLNNENIKLFNQKLEELCESKNCRYVDINTVMGGEYLKAEFCSDPDGMGIHFTDKACGIWCDRLNEIVNSINGE